MYEIENSSNLESYQKIQNFFKKHKIFIATISLNCKLKAKNEKDNVVIDIDSFAQNVALKENGIVSTKFGKRKKPASKRAIISVKAKKETKC